MTKTKKAGVGNVGTEEVAEVEAMILNREDTKTQADILFERSKKSREQARKTVDSLFIQAPAAKIRGAKLVPESTRVEAEPSLLPFFKAASAGNFEKVAEIERLSSSKNTIDFFEKRAYLSPAQKRFPELIKAASFITGDPQPTPTMKARKSDSSTGAKPTRPAISGGDS